MRSLPTRPVAAIVLASSLLAISTAAAQDAKPDEHAPANQDVRSTATGGPVAVQVDQFLHYILIARPDQAAAAGKAIMSSGVSDAALAETVDKMNLGEKLDRALSKGRAMEGGVAELVGLFETKLERGRLELARDSARVKEAVAMLDGTLRAKALARERLLKAGEYAVPALLGQLVDGKNPKIQVAAIDTIVEIKGQAVAPLCAALPSLDPTNQRRVAEMLAQIAWPSAIPALRAVAEDPKTASDVKSAAQNAIARLGGSKGSLSQAYTSLAKDFFLRRIALMPYPEEATNNLWAYDNFGGLRPTPVPTPIFFDVMSMKLAEMALRADPTNADAVAVYVASDLRRENDLPKDAKDPVYGGQTYSPNFYATVIGPAIGQQVLAMAIDTGDTALVRDAIAALAQTGGPTLTAAGGRAPLIECLSYPDRRVQYDAAIALGNAMPNTHFVQDTAVVPLLASAVRTAGTQYAAVVAPDEEDRRQLAGSLSSLGFTIVGTAGSWGDLVASSLAGSLLDLVATRGRSDQLTDTLKGVRSSNVTSATPVLVVAAQPDRNSVERLFMADRRVAVWTAGSPQDTFKNSIDQLMMQASGGPIAEDEAITYAMSSLETLKNIAVARTPVYRIEDSERALAEALDTRQGSVRLMVADVLALIPTPTAQRKLLDAALSAKDDEQVQLLDRVATSGRRWGNQAEPRQVASLRELVGKSTGATADASAHAYGALNLPPDQAVKLILK